MVELKANYREEKWFQGHCFFFLPPHISTMFNNYNIRYSENSPKTVSRLGFQTFLFCRQEDKKLEGLVLPSSPHLFLFLSHHVSSH
jgi:hypothetical protein